jgi:hypothetical protein
VFLLLTLVGPSVPTRAFTFPQFGDTIHDYGVDLDGDGLYDELRVDFTATVLENGTYGFEATLGTQSFPYIVHDAFDKTLTAGTHSFTFTFLGPYLRKAGADGPYVVMVRGSTVVGNARWCCSEKSYATSAYSALSFDPPWALFADPITDQGRDTNGDGLFDEIVVQTAIVATKEVVVRAYTSMPVNGPDGQATVESPIGDSRRFPQGTSAIEFSLRTLPLFTIHANGPYSVNLYLFVEELGGIDYRTHQTQPYAYSQFRRPSADFRAPGPSVALADTDNNGLADFFVVHVPLRVTEAGDFVVYVNLWLNAGFFYSAQGAHFEPGDHAVDVPFSGIALSRPPHSANWTLEALVKRVDSTDYDENRTTWLVPGYDPSRFESRPLVYFSGQIVGPGNPYPSPCGTVSLMDPSTKFVAEQDANGGAFSYSVYPGTFLVLVSGCRLAGARTSRVTISGDTQLALALENSTPNSYDIDTNVTSWNSTRRTVRSTLIDAAPEIRFHADVYGNRDGFANLTEVRIIREAESGYFLQGLSSSQLTIDGRDVPLRSFVSYQVDGAGDVLSSANVTETHIEDYWSHLESTGGRHNVTLGLSYKGPGAIGVSRVTVRLPANSTGTVTSTGNVTIVRLGPAAWLIEPGVNPNALLSPAYVYIDASSPESPGRGLVGVLGSPLLWVGMVAAIAAGIGAAWWFRRRQRVRPPEGTPSEEPKNDGT